MVLLYEVSCPYAAAVLGPWDAAMFGRVGGVFKEEGCPVCCVASGSVVDVELSCDECGVCVGFLLVVVVVCGQSPAFRFVPAT